MSHQRRPFFRNEDRSGSTSPPSPGQSGQDHHNNNMYNARGISMSDGSEVMNGSDGSNQSTNTIPRNNIHSNTSNRHHSFNSGHVSPLSRRKSINSHTTSNNNDNGHKQDRMDHSWSAGGSRRRANTSSTSNGLGGSVGNHSPPASSSTSYGNNVQRHHSSDLPFQRNTAQPRSFSSTKARSSGGTRQRPSPQVARAIRRNVSYDHGGGMDGSSNTNSLLMDLSSNSHSHSNPHSMNDLQQRYPTHVSPMMNNGNNNNHHQHNSSSYPPQDTQQRSTSTSVPYGMLNPGPSGFFYGSKGGGYYPNWIRRMTQSRDHNGNNNGKPHYPSSSSHGHHNNSNQPFAFYQQYYAAAAPQHYLLMFGFCIIVILALAVYQHDHMLQEALRMKELEVTHHLGHARALEQRVNTLRSQTFHLEEMLEEMEEKQKEERRKQEAAAEEENNKKKNGKKSKSEKGKDEARIEVFHLEHANLKMRQDVQAMSTRMVKEKFGDGPKYYVEMKLEFDPHSNVYAYKENGDNENKGAPATIDGESRDTASLIIETAPIDIMPHSVHLFLEQVSNGLFDGTAFHINAAHIVQAGPSFLGGPAHSKFRHHPSLNSVVFQEYAPEMKHKKGTLGYHGRPGGPDFYVNMKDNSATHGPGGQAHHFSNVVADADPCFAKIVRGYEVMERVHLSKVKFQTTMEYPVKIVEMKVLPSDFTLSMSGSLDENERDQDIL